MNIQKHKQSKSRRLQKTALSWVTMIVGFLLGCRVFAANPPQSFHHLKIAPAVQEQTELATSIDDDDDFWAGPGTLKYVLITGPNGESIISFVQNGQINPTLSRNLYERLNLAPPDFEDYALIQIQSLIVRPGDAHSAQGQMFTAHVLYATRQNPSQVIDVPVQGFVKIRGSATLTANDINSKDLRFKIALSPLKHANFIQEVAGDHSPNEPQFKTELAETVVGAVLRDYYFTVKAH